MSASDGPPAPATPRATAAGIDAPRDFPVLDALRGVAALAVVLRHMPAFVDPGLLGSSYLAVDLFFAMSGFVLAHAYGERLAARPQPWRFARVRLARLYPLYLAGTLIGLLVAMTSRAAIGAKVAASLAFALAFLPVPAPLSSNGFHIFPLDGPAWSLFFELVVNVGYAALAQRLGLRALALVLAGGAAALVAGALHYGTLDTGFTHADALGAVGRAWWGFFAGVALHALWRRAADRPPRLPPALAPALLLAVLAVRPGVEWRTAFELLASLVLLPGLVWLGARSRAEGSALRLATALGRASFALYALHLPLILLAARTGIARVVPPALAGIVVLALLVAISLGAERFLDRPARARLPRRWRRLA